MIPSRLKIQPSTAAFLLVAFVATAPAWIVRYLPVMDLPFHLATIRVMHNFHDASFGFDQHYVLTLGRTQYVLFYFLGSFLAYFVGVRGAMVLLVSAYLGGTVLGLRELLKALGKDERLALFAVPLLVNMLFMYGLFQFLIGIPIMFLGLALAVKWFEAPTQKLGIGLGVTAFALFFSHIVPFAIFGLGFAAMFPWTAPRKWIENALPVVPSLGALVWWTTFTEAGKLTLGALVDTGNDPHLPVDEAIHEIPRWLTNVFADYTDDVIFVCLLAVVLLAAGLSQGDTDVSVKKIARAYVLLPLACVYFYFTSPTGHGYIWLIQQRFPVLFALTVIPLLRMPKDRRGVLVTALALILGLASTVNTCRHFIRFQNEELGEFDEALAQIEPNKKVCGLMFDRGSSITNPSFAPFLHYVSYYQAEKGGVTMFSYAGYAHWPFTFRDDDAPPGGAPARLRWEWEPDRVNLEREILPYYDYVLSRGDNFHPSHGMTQTWSDSRWHVWKVDRSSGVQ